ncbi:MAG: toxin-antitoxin system YwqK family antitoxin, partial [Proteobacteria bacterium]|nr:toxin-antitoxin system YwqK family antitoxin [Pseudomonadota bacterium]
YHDNGQQKSVGNYVYGKKDGEWKFFDEEGKLERSEHWVEGEK